MENINNENTNEDNISEGAINDGDEHVPQDEVVSDELSAEDTESSFSVDDTDELGFTHEDTGSEGTGSEEPAFAGAGAPPPPEGQYLEHRLTRDPFATFGGVLSGIAHRYGWDVSLTRLAFVVALVASGGGAVLVYLLAWLIIPRALYWPPVMRNRSASQVSGRDIGVGLIVLAVIVMIGIGGGQAASVLVPLALIGAGVWMLVQSPRGDSAPAAAFAGTPAPLVEDAQVSSGPAYQMPAVAPMPAPRRSRRSKGAIVGVIGLVVLVPVLFVGGLIFAVGSDPDLLIEFDGPATTYSPSTIDEIPTDISEDEEHIIIDLTNVDFSSIDTPAERVEIDVDLNWGEIEVFLPADVRADVSADAALAGAVDLFDEQTEGLFPDDALFSDDDPQLVMDINVDGGKITVERAG